MADRSQIDNACSEHSEINIIGIYNSKIYLHVGEEMVRLNYYVISPFDDSDQIPISIRLNIHVHCKEYQKF